MSKQNWFHCFISFHYSNYCSHFWKTFLKFVFTIIFCFSSPFFCMICVCSNWFHTINIISKKKVHKLYKRVWKSFNNNDRHKISCSKEQKKMYQFHAEEEGKLKNNNINIRLIQRKTSDGLEKVLLLKIYVLFFCIIS